eukprot:3773248-Pyramimonas_sp.AAC.2
MTIIIYCESGDCLVRKRFFERYCEHSRALRESLANRFRELRSMRYDFSFRMRLLVVLRTHEKKRSIATIGGCADNNDGACLH